MDAGNNRTRFTLAVKVHILYDLFGKIQYIQRNRCPISSKENSMLSPSEEIKRIVNEASSDMLTPTEEKQLKRKLKEASAYFQKEFAHFGPQKD